jgi:hypothetical protein
VQHQLVFVRFVGAGVNDEGFQRCGHVAGGWKCGGKNKEVKRTAACCRFGLYL